MSRVERYPASWNDPATWRLPSLLVDANDDDALYSVERMMVDGRSTKLPALSLVPRDHNTRPKGMEGMEETMSG